MRRAGSKTGLAILGCCLGLLWQPAGAAGQAERSVLRTARVVALQEASPSDREETSDDKTVEPLRPPKEFAPTTPVRPVAASRPVAESPNLEPRYDPPPAPHAGERLDAAPADAPLHAHGDTNCDVCCEPACSAWWFRGEYLYWWTRGMRTPPLVSESPRGTRGVIGQPGTNVLVGQDRLFDDPRPGGRLRLGYWLDDCCLCGIEADYGALKDERFHYCAFGGGEDRTIARPFVDARNGTNNAELVAFRDPVGAPNAGIPDELAGGIDVVANTAWQTAGVRLRGVRTVRYGGDGGWSTSLDLMAGYRWMRLDERLSVREDLVSLEANANLAFDILDRFGTQTEFHGAELALLWQAARERWSLEVLGRLAFGNNNQHVDIHGFTVETDTLTGVPNFAAPGGLLTQSSNIGIFRRNRFAFIPEIDLTLGYQAHERIRVMLGYTFLLWTNVVRVGEQIDPVVNPNLLPGMAGGAGPARPMPLLNDTTFWAQGLSLGFEVTW